MDDLLIDTETVDEQLEILEKVMELVQINGLRLRYDKCKFMFNRIVYLETELHCDASSIVLAANRCSARMMVDFIPYFIFRRALLMWNPD